MAKPIREILKKNRKFAVNGRIWIECNGKRFFGPGPLELLDLINNTGSITRAAKQMKMSYKKAWGITSTLNTGGRKPVVGTQTGGNGGGGSIITDEAKAMIAWYRELDGRFQTFLEKRDGEIK